jgi:hypothetical protein
MSEEKKIRYFVYGTGVCSDLEQSIKRGETEDIFQIVAYDSKVVKRLIWFLLKQNISFSKQSMGAGITILYIDKTVAFFTS